MGSRPVGPVIAPVNIIGPLTPGHLGLCPSFNDAVNGWIRTGRFGNVQRQCCAVDRGPRRDLTGAVAEDGREFYAISTEFDPDSAKPWVKENVLPHLEPRGDPVWKPRAAIAKEFLAFVGDEPAEFWSLIATYDWYLVTRLLFGGLDDLPSNWPMECWDLHQWAWRLGNPEFPSFEGLPHHALRDAHYHKRVYAFLVDYERKHRRTQL